MRNHCKYETTNPLGIRGCKLYICETREKQRLFECPGMEHCGYWIGTMDVR